MPPNDTRYAREWLGFAEKDLGRATRALQENDPEIAGFFVQQAVEKFLKAFLLAKGWKLVRTHNLVALLDEAAAHDATLNRFRLVCHDISLFYLDSRYPATLTGGWSEQEVRDSLRDVQELIEQIRAALKT
jgi:HEPN domain-containing protein